MAVDSKVIFDQGWLFRYTRSTSAGRHRLLLMLHGWTGNEDSMNVFQRNLPDYFFMVAPRGIIALDEGGYGWLSGIAGKDASLVAFREPVGALAKILPYWLQLQPDSLPQISLMGFSQGAALALSFSLYYPHLVDRVVAMAGFLPYLPDGFIPDKAVKSTQYFIAHGSQDSTVPIERAQQAKVQLENFGASVTYCEDAVRHRISSRCLRSVQQFLALPPLDK
jgi:phospholipase/carboxylesterase